MNELALFAGAGGGILGGKLLGWRTVCAVEWEAYAASVLCARQNDGALPAFPIWDDVRTFDGRPWRGIVDVVSGGFPCQDISAAGKGAGIEGERSGMWTEMARIIGEVRPRFAFVENSPMLTSRGLGRVLGDLAALGYDARWGVLGAVDAGAPHKRDRIWIVADARRITTRADTDIQREVEKPKRSDFAVIRSDVSNADNRGHRRWEQQPQCSEGAGHVADGICDTASAGLSHWAREPLGQPSQDAQPERSTWWATEPDLGRVAHGVAARVDRLKAIGNGQVPAVAALAWEMLTA